eukprot:TRINITY_DN10535_c0_g1_i1.p1 TRINITY_DN10535_c0_g1~~TRINITY_DN10535_c0_g1_i1.p1  ORF type:complete len:235 (+),score=116.99 TRINITY_DN10535_c0_g1_i1:545-1249(+)
MPAILPPNCLFRPENSLKIVWTIFQKMHAVNSGKFLLSHKSGDHNILIYSQVEDSHGNLDLQLQLQHPLQVDLETIPYVPTKWVPSMPNQIPETLPIDPRRKSIFAKFQVEKPQMSHGKFLGVKCCHAFAEHGVCNNEFCHYSHMYPDEIRKRSREKHKKTKKKKQERKKEERQKQKEEKLKKKKKSEHHVIPKLPEEYVDLDGSRDLQVESDEFEIGLKKLIQEREGENEVQN